MIQKKPAKLIAGFCNAIFYIKCSLRSQTCFDRLSIRIVNANTELIPEAPNRQAIYLIGAVVPVRTATVAVQEAAPSLVRIGLCRTPPVTAVANGVVTSIAVAGPARKTSK